MIYKCKYVTLLSCVRYSKSIIQNSKLILLIILGQKVKTSNKAGVNE